MSLLDGLWVMAQPKVGRKLQQRNANSIICNVAPWMRFLRLVLRRCTKNELVHLVRDKDESAWTAMLLVSTREGV